MCTHPQSRSSVPGLLLPPVGLKPLPQGTQGTPNVLAVSMSRTEMVARMAVRTARLRPTQLAARATATRTQTKNRKNLRVQGAGCSVQGAGRVNRGWAAGRGMQVLLRSWQLCGRHPHVASGARVLLSAQPQAPGQSTHVILLQGHTANPRPVGPRGRQACPWPAANPRVSEGVRPRYSSAADDSDLPRVPQVLQT